MKIAINDVMSKTDWIKIIVLLAVSGACWTWVYIEYQKPIIPEGWEELRQEVTAKTIESDTTF